MIGCQGDITACTCTNCTEREAKVMAEANARRKALLALDQAMTDLRYAIDDAAQCSDERSSAMEIREILTGRIANANEAWQAAQPYITS